nr:MAG TPA: hypothetical protein [Caudoviricetes sp.]
MRIFSIEIKMMNDFNFMHKKRHSKVSYIIILLFFNIFSH